jgi:hypothetical protein
MRGSSPPNAQEAARDDASDPQGAAERSVSVWRIVRSEAVHCCRVRSVTATCEED